jgi:hypothetical protein
MRLELLLKSLLLLDNGKYQREHELDELFAALTLKTQDRIRDHYNQLSASDKAISDHQPGFDKSIENILRLSKDAFVKFRYFPTETFQHMEGFVAGDVTESALFVIGEDHPEWR